MSLNRPTTINITLLHDIVCIVIHNDFATYDIIMNNISQ